MANLVKKVAGTVKSLSRKQLPKPAGMLQNPAQSFGEQVMQSFNRAGKVAAKALLKTRKGKRKAAGKSTLDRVIHGEKNPLERE